MSADTKAALIIRLITERTDDDAAIDTAAIGMFTADMAARLQDKRDDGRHGWWDEDTCSVQTLARMLHGFIHRGELLDAANLCMFLYCRDGGAEAVRRMMQAKSLSLHPDPLGEALNSGDGTYRP